MKRKITIGDYTWPLDLGLIARVEAADIAAHTGDDGEHGGLSIPEGIETRCDVMEVWGSNVDPFTNHRSEEAVVWSLVFLRGREIVARVDRPDPTPQEK